MVHGVAGQQGKRVKWADRPKNDPKTRLLAKLQAEMHKVHGDPLDTLKKNRGEEEGELRLDAIHNCRTFRNQRQPDYVD